MDANAASAIECMVAGMHVHPKDAVRSRTFLGTKCHSAGRKSSFTKSGRTCISHDKS